MSEPTCSSCRWWDHHDEPWADIGFCRRKTPRIGKDETGHGKDARWPTTGDGDWCGEHTECAS